jgi:protease I
LGAKELGAKELGAKELGAKELGAKELNGRSAYRGRAHRVVPQCQATLVRSGGSGDILNSDGECLVASLAGKKIAVLATDGVEQVELTEPIKALRQANAEVVVIAPKSGQIQGMNHHDKGDMLRVDHDLASVSPDRFDGLMLPGGVANPDELRTNEKAVSFVRHFVQERKPIAAICHGPWTLIEAEGVRGRRMTSWPSLRTDLKKAGANWEDRSVVVDNGLVTSRKPDDLPDFCREMVKLFEGAAARRAA